MTWTNNADVNYLRLREEWPGAGCCLPVAPIPSNLAQGAPARLLPDWPGLSLLGQAQGMQAAGSHGPLSTDAA